MLLHAFATTQTLLDGNKRTAWASCWTFLVANEAVPLYVTQKFDPDVAEQMVLAVAAGQYDDITELAARLNAFALLHY